ncbi:histamine H3 receptor-like [Saccoglossus kowalevskii]|uniref:Octopamine receptor 1-like n=1 Tax=Saccoglossus kowalevskii TaxID=10224 RepID=A0ABM0MTX4_SACKO|nr:PREDICTED: octopamine receptor 1-like [Saccoglossus kowalevskii]
MNVTTITYTAYSNGSETEDDSGDVIEWDGVKVFAICFLCCVDVATIIGNTFTLLAFGTDSKLRNNLSNWYIINLSIADLLVGAVSLPFDIAAYAYDYWIFGKHTCRFWSVVDNIATVESVFAVLLISFDRFSLVTMEIRHVTMQTRKKVFYQCFSTWVFTVVLIFILVVAYPAWTGEVWFDYGEVCDVEFLYDTAWTVFFVVITFVIPLIILLYLNVTIYLNIHKRTTSRVQPASGTSQLYNTAVKTQVTLVNLNNGQASDALRDSGRRINVCEPSVSVYNNGEEFSENANNQENDTTHRRAAHRKNKGVDHKLQKRKKAARTLAILVGVFFLCWAPHNLAVVVDQLCSDYCVTDFAWVFVSYLQWVNSTLNPILYAVCHPGFRENFKKLFMCKCSSR